MVLSSIIFPYKNLVLFLTLSLSLTLILTFLKLPVYFLYGLYTYIHPDSTDSSQVKAAIRRPSSSDSSFDSNIKRRKSTKEKFEFDESKAQIFRLKLDENHLVTRVYFNAYKKNFNYVVIALSCFVLSKCLDGGNDEKGVILNGNAVPIMLGLLAVCEVSLSVIRVSFERSASRRSEKQLGGIVGLVGFMVGLVITFEGLPSLFDFEFGSVDGLWRFFVAVLMGCFAGFLFMPAVKNARSFWIGTDQLRWNLSIISCGLVSRVLLYINCLLIVFTSLLWISPLGKLLVNNNVGKAKDKVGEAEKLIGNVGMLKAEFDKFRIGCLLLSGIMQIVVLRPNLQMFLNEAVLCWYQRLHAGKVPDLEFSRAKVFLHNHYLCLVVVQYFAAPALVLLLLGLSQIADKGNSFKHLKFLSSSLPSSDFAKQAALCMAWWVVFVWSVFASATLVLYRRGILYVS